MAPNAKKGGSKNSVREQRSSSRQSTPLSAISDAAPLTPQAGTPPATSAPATSLNTMPKETAYIHTSTSALVSADSSIESLIEKSNGNSANPPSARELHALHDRIRDGVNRFMVKRGEVCDRSMRQLAQKRKERIQMEREVEAARAEKEAKAKKKVGKKRSHEEMEVDGEVEEAERKADALPSVGAHGIARQDGVGVHEGTCGISFEVTLSLSLSLSLSVEAGIRGSGHLFTWYRHNLHYLYCFDRHVSTHFYLTLHPHRVSDCQAKNSLLRRTASTFPQDRTRQTQYRLDGHSCLSFRLGNFSSRATVNRAFV